MSIETFRRIVAPAHCDHLGHMNVQYYMAAIGEGMFATMAAIGLGPREIERRRMAFAAVHEEATYKLELVPGDAIRLMSQVAAVGTKSITVRHRLERVEDGAIAYECQVKAALLDLDGRKAIPIPDDLRVALEARLADTAD